MFNDSDNGQTQYCKECQKWSEKCSKLEEKLKDLHKKQYDLRSELIHLAGITKLADEIHDNLNIQYGKDDLTIHILLYEIHSKLNELLKDTMFEIDDIKKVRGV